MYYSCNCKKIRCGDRRCGCMKRGQGCNSGCGCLNCLNGKPFYTTQSMFVDSYVKPSNFYDNRQNGFNRRSQPEPELFPNISYSQIQQPQVDSLFTRVKVLEDKLNNSSFISQDNRSNNQSFFNTSMINNSQMGNEVTEIDMDVVNELNNNQNGETEKAVLDKEESKNKAFKEEESKDRASKEEELKDIVFDQEELKDNDLSAEIKENNNLSVSSSFSLIQQNTKYEDINKELIQEDKDELDKSDEKENLFTKKKEQAEMQISNSESDLLEDRSINKEETVNSIKEKSIANDETIDLAESQNNEYTVQLDSFNNPINPNPNSFRNDWNPNNTRQHALEESIQESNQPENKESDQTSKTKRDSLYKFKVLNNISNSTVTDKKKVIINNYYAEESNNKSGLNEMSDTSNISEVTINNYYYKQNGDKDREIQELKAKIKESLKDLLILLLLAILTLLSLDYWDLTKRTLETATYYFKQILNSFIRNIERLKQKLSDTIRIRKKD